ncbi:vesicle transport through interaction with t-SNAREs homolog 1A isoform X3 [Sminthopsis crassicaudata]|uniref:vesicle transport through interaction with t-SNAREs homolog 1A isoform X3 n=1 Tax=Sminthopsis crassicaudata TaxID=9301 RepID=UPI003D685ED0
MKEGSVGGTEYEQTEFTEGPDAQVAQPGSGRSGSCPGFSLQPLPPLPPGDFRRFGAAAPSPLRAEPQTLTTAMSSDFEGYEQDFAVLTAEITSKIGRVPKLSPDEKKQMVANVEKQLEEAKELLEQMDLEVREIPPQNRGMYISRMRSYKQEMGKLETDFKRSRIAYSDEVRNELLGDDGNSSENQLIKLREERAHLLDNTERLERSSRRLEAGYQIAVETVLLDAFTKEEKEHPGQLLHCGKTVVTLSESPEAEMQLSIASFLLVLILA